MKSENDEPSTSTQLPMHDTVPPTANPTGVGIDELQAAPGEAVSGTNFALDQFTAQPGDEVPVPPRRPRRSSGNQASNKKPNRKNRPAEPDEFRWSPGRNTRGIFCRRPIIWSYPRPLDPNQFAKMVASHMPGVEFEVADGTKLNSSLLLEYSRIPVILVDRALELAAQQYRDERLSRNGCSITRIHQLIVRLSEVIEIQSMVYPNVGLKQLATDGLFALEAIFKVLSSYREDLW